MKSDNSKSSDVQELDTSELEVVVNSLGAGVCRIDKEGAVTYLNEAAAEILAVLPGKTLGQSYAEMFFGPNVTKDDPKCAPIEFSFSEGEVAHINTEEVVRGDGTVFFAELFCAPVPEDKGGGAVISFIDVTDRREIEGAIFRAREEALAAARSKAEFLANMSHEIRTPLTGIIGTVDLLRSTKLDSDQAEYLRMLRTSTKLLHSIVNDILDFSKIEAGKFLPNSETFSVATMLDECVSASKPLLRDKNVEISLEVEAEVPEFVTGDQRIVRQVVNNLLSNAIKFTDSGSIQVKATKAEDERVKFLIRDTGIGIPAADLKDIFDAFVQADASTRRAHPGTGLGLAISNKLVSLVDGEMDISSEVGSGTSIWFEIPLPKAEFKAEKIADADLRQELAGGLKILIVEDNPINLRVTQKMLERHGVAPDLAENGSVAVEACRKKKYDIVLMDCQMPVMDGFEAAKIIKTEQQNGPAIIAFTASVTDGDLAGSPQGRMDALLRKPFTENDLIEILKVKSDIGISAENLDLGRDFSEHSVSRYVDLETLARLSALETKDSRGFLVEILEVFAVHTESKMVLLSDFVSSGDRESVRKTAHNLKGSSANVGIFKLSGLFEDLELESESSDMEALEELLHKITVEFEAVNKAIAELKDKEDPNES